MNQQTINDETVMPDGRPFFAWRNEISMLRNQELELSSSRKELNNLMKLLRIAKIEQQHEPWSGDIIVRFKMIDAVINNDPMGKYTVEDAEYLEVKNDKAM